MDRLINELHIEYNLIQNKIDKIADFALKVRGWCITLESALLLSLVSGNVHFSSPYNVIMLMLLIVLVFQFLEQEQLEISRRRRNETEG